MTKDEVLEILDELSKLPAGTSYEHNGVLWTIDWVGWPISGVLREAAQLIRQADTC